MSKKLEDKIKQTDWDNLIILDACRYDYFKKFKDEYFNIGEVEKVESPESATPKVFPKIFDREDRENRVLHNQNITIKHSDKSEEWSQIDIEPSEYFEEVIPYWKKEVLNAKEFYNEYNHREGKQNVIWLIQPHEPYRGDLEVSGSIMEVAEEVESFKLKQYMDTALKSAYKYNLRHVLYWATVLAAELEGETYITADHGELLGEENLYGHPDKDKTELRTVPWAKINGDTNPEELSDSQFIEQCFKNLLNQDEIIERDRKFHEEILEEKTRQEYIRFLGDSEAYNRKNPEKIDFILPK